MKRTLTTLLMALGFAFLASPAFAATLTEEDVVLGKVDVITIYCVRTPCPGPYVRLVNPGQPDVLVTGDLARAIGANEKGKTIAVTGVLCADGKKILAKSYLPFSDLPVEPEPAVQQGANVARKAKTQPTGAATQSTQRSGAAGAGLQRD